MISRTILGSLLAAVVLFVWGFVYYTLLPINNMVSSKVPNEIVTLDMLKMQLPKEGVYVLPYPKEFSESQKTTKTGPSPAAVKETSTGPYARIFFKPEASYAMSAKDFVLGYLHLLASALLVGLLLTMARNQLPRFWQRWLFVVTAGTFAAIYVQLGGPIWFRHPWGYDLATAAFYQIGSWVLAGFPLAMLIKPRTL